MAGAAPVEIMSPAYMERICAFLLLADEAGSEPGALMRSPARPALAPLKKSSSSRAEPADRAAVSDAGLTPPSPSEDDDDEDDDDDVDEDTPAAAVVVVACG